MAKSYKPKKSDKFAFGVWCVMNRGRDPFGVETRPAITGLEAVRGLAKHGAYGFEFHDNDLIPFDATAAEQRKIVAELKRIMKSTGIRATAGTANMFTHPVFRDGAFTSHDPEVRAFAVRKTMNFLDVAAELDTRVYIFWGGREGAEVDGAKDPVEALQHLRECVNFICEYIIDRRYPILVSIEPKPNEPRGDMYLPTTGHALAFIETLEHPFMVGTNPEFAHIKMAGLNPYHEYAQALEVGKLFDVHLNGQKVGRFDQDMSIGADGLKDIFFVCKLLKDYAYEGTVAIDAHPFRTEVEPWDFVDRCMCSWRMLCDKVAALNADREYRQLMAPLVAQKGPLAAALGQYTAANAAKLRSHAYRPDKMAVRPLPYERIDQIVNEVLMGVR